VAKNNDKELLSLFREENTRHHAFNIIIRKYQERLYWHVRRIVISHDDADDVIQNTFIRVWNSLEKFHGASKLYTWLYRIATNEALSFLKQHRKKLIIPIDTVENILENSLESDSFFNGDEIQMKLQKAILSLPEKQRLVFNMKYFDVMKYEEMAKILNTSVGALKASYHHAVKKIEKKLGEG
jgi:RNA polymerase sigma-70 factor (ECF subfamily)